MVHNVNLRIKIEKTVHLGYEFTCVTVIFTCKNINSDLQVKLFTSKLTFIMTVSCFFFLKYDVVHKPFSFMGNAVTPTSPVAGFGCHFNNLRRRRLKNLISFVPGDVNFLLQNIIIKIEYVSAALSL